MAESVHWPSDTRTSERRPSKSKIYQRELRSNTESIKTSLPTVIVTYCILVLLLVIVLNAIPALRSKHHNRFEVTHRFLGWAATLLVWCQVRLQSDGFVIVDRIANSGHIVNERL